MNRQLHRFSRHSFSPHHCSLSSLLQQQEAAQASALCWSEHVTMTGGPLELGPETNIKNADKINHNTVQIHVDQHNGVETLELKSGKPIPPLIATFSSPP